MRLIFPHLLILFAATAAVALFSATARGDAPEHATVGVSVASYSSLPGTTAWLAMPVAPPSAVGAPSFGTSVMPPTPAPDEWCSTFDVMFTSCSAQVEGAICSGKHGNENLCSAYNVFDSFSVVCSALANDTVCSVLPPVEPIGALGHCSALTVSSLEPQQTCSVIGVLASGPMSGQCSIKGQGSSVCSAGSGSAIQMDCSVINSGFTINSFCSVKLGTPALAKGCSTLTSSSNESCSVVLGGKGKCTAFGMADPASCSVLGPTGSHCSIIGGPAGSFCTQ